MASSKIFAAFFPKCSVKTISWRRLFGNERPVEATTVDMSPPSMNMSFVSPPQPDPANPTTSWRWGKKTVVDRRDELLFEKDKKTGDWRVYTRTWEPTEGVTPRSLLVEKEHGRNRDGTQELDDLIGPKVFTNPKPTRLLRHLLNIGLTGPDDLVMDFFAGSGSLGHAVIDYNVDNGTACHYLMVQLP